MPIVTISRQFGAGGSSVAGLVASELGAEVVDKKLIEEVASRLSMRPSDVEAEDERPRTLMERLVRSFSVPRR
jgi:cytidylate kinase